MSTIKRVKFSEAIIESIKSLKDWKHLNITDINGRVTDKIEPNSIVQMIRNTQEFMGLLIDFAIFQPKFTSHDNTNMIDMDKKILEFDFEEKQVLMPINKNLQPKLQDDFLDT